jgi:hypothetical protein
MDRAEQNESRALATKPKAAFEEAYKELGHLFKTAANRAESHNQAALKDGHLALDHDIYPASGLSTMLRAMEARSNAPAAQPGDALPGAVSPTGDARPAAVRTTDAPGAVQPTERQHSTTTERATPGDAHSHQTPERHTRSTEQGKTVPAGEATVNGTDQNCFWKIAQKHLGPHASAGDVLKYARKIAEENFPNDRKNGKDPLNHMLHPNDHLKLPEYKMGEGSHQHQQQHQRHEQHHLRQDQQRQGQDQQRQGQDQQRQGQDQQRDTQDTKTDTTKDVASNPDVVKQRQALQDAEKNITDPAQRAEFERNRQAFETRAQKDQLPPDEVAKSYEQMTKLLTADKGAATPENRQLLAENFMNQVAHPKQTDQGNYNTCNVTTLAEHNEVRHPSKMAELITTTALTGSWTAPDGKNIKIDANSLVPQPESATHPPKDGDRSFATQVMNVVMVNDITQRRNPPEYYSQEASEGNNDNGERLRYANGTEVPSYEDKTKGARSPTVDCAELEQQQQRISGDKGTLIERGELNNNKVHEVHSPEELKEYLLEMKREHKLPATVMLDANGPGFWNNPNATKPAWHVVSVTDIDEKTGKVFVDNQWGSQNDKWMPIDTLYKSMYLNQYNNRNQHQNFVDQS